MLFPEPYNPKVEAVMEKHNQSLKHHMAEGRFGIRFLMRTLILLAVMRRILKVFENYENAAECISAFKLCEQYGGVW